MASLGGRRFTAATSDRPICILCMSITKAKERCTLHSPSTRHVIPALEKFLSEFNPTLAPLVVQKDSSMCTNYTIEAFTLLVQEKYLLSP